MRRKPGTDTKFPAQFAGNWLSVPGFAPRDMLLVPPKAVRHAPLESPSHAGIPRVGVKVLIIPQQPELFVVVIKLPARVPPHLRSDPHRHQFGRASCRER